MKYSIKKYIPPIGRVDGTQRDTTSTYTEH